MEPNIEIRVNHANPGEFFACCGLLELADRLGSGAEGWFAPGWFLIAFLDPDKAITIHKTLWLLANAGVEEESDDKESALSLGEPINMRLNWWVNSNGKKNILKTWAGNQTSLKMYSKWRSPLKDFLSNGDFDSTELFHRQYQLQGPYGFDSKFGWDTLSLGFSLNSHPQYKKSQVRPVVEILSAIGLQRFVPNMDVSKRRVQYATWNVPLSPPVARLAAAGILPHAILARMESEVTNRGSYKEFATAQVRRGDFDD